MAELIEANQSTEAIPKTFQVHFERTKNKVEWRAESNLLDLAVAANAALDYNQFLFDELDEANFKENELEELDADLPVKC